MLYTNAKPTLGHSFKYQFIGSCIYVLIIFELKSLILEMLFLHLYFSFNYTPEDLFQVQWYTQVYYSLFLMT